MNNLVFKNLSKWNRLMTEILGFEELIKYIDPNYKIYQDIQENELSSHEIISLDQFLNYLTRYLIQDRFKFLNRIQSVQSKTTRNTESVEALNDNLIKRLLCERLNDYPNENYDSKLKRGQYRKYESDQLNKALGAVLNGSMSVHKAGSCYGIPHSTLEYKLKERTVFQQKNTNYVTFY